MAEKLGTAKARRKARKDKAGKADAVTQESIRDARDVMAGLIRGFNAKGRRRTVRRIRANFKD